MRANRCRAGDTASTGCAVGRVVIDKVGMCCIYNANSLVIKTGLLDQADNLGDQHWPGDEQGQRTGYELVFQDCSLCFNKDIVPIRFKRYLQTLVEAYYFLDKITFSENENRLVE